VVELFSGVDLVDRLAQPRFNLLIGVESAVAQPPLLSGGASIDLAVPLYQSRVVTVITPANRVSVANPDVADIVVISPVELYVLGKDIGTTNVLLWDNNSHLIGAINVEVQHDLENLKRKFAELLPGQPIEVRSSQRSIVLSGRVSDAESMNAATRIAATFLAQVQTATKTLEFKQSAGSGKAGDIINLLQVGGACTWASWPYARWHPCVRRKMGRSPQSWMAAR